MALSVAQWAQVSNWFVSTSPKTVAVTWSTGDRLVAAALTSDAQGLTFGTPTLSGGPAFSLETQLNGGASEAGLRIWSSAAASSGGSNNVSLTLTSTNTVPWGYAVWVITGNPSGTANVTSNQTEAAISRTVSAGSVVIYVFGDWNANQTNQTIATGSGAATERLDDGNGTNYGMYCCDWVGVSAGTFNFGVTSYTGLKVAHGVIEVLAPSGTSITPPAGSVPITGTTLTMGRGIGFPLEP